MHNIILCLIFTFVTLFSSAHGKKSIHDFDFKKPLFHQTSAQSMAQKMNLNAWQNTQLESSIATMKEYQKLNQLKHASRLNEVNDQFKSVRRVHSRPYLPDFDHSL